IDPLATGDLGRLRGWLQLSDVQGWWGSAARAEAEVAMALASPSAICRIVHTDGEAVGYAHALDGALMAGAGRPELPGSWDCALFIASPAHRGRGIGASALELLVAEVFATTLAVGCTIRVPVAKESAVRVVEAAGFSWSHVEEDAALGRVWVLACERPRR
ncbi:MAG: GNAT family N-acetyltransferase, partial [Hyphomicrobiaceae bacterium]